MDVTRKDAIKRFRFSALGSGGFRFCHRAAHIVDMKESYSVSGIRERISHYVFP